MNRIIIENVADFDPVHTFECGQCFRWIPAGDGSGDYTGAAGSYAARLSYIRDSEEDSYGKKGSLIIEATGGDEEFWRNYFDLDTDYGRIKEDLVMHDPRIAPAVRYGRGIRILDQDLFETIISFIISQNNNIPRIRKNIESLCRTYGQRIGEISGREIYSFPAPEALACAELSDLEELRLGYRAGYIKSAGERYMTCSRPVCRDDILAYKGIGPKVANCIMLFGLRDTCAFPVDTWVRHIMNDMYGFNEQDTRGMMEFAADRFGSLAGYAQQYLFYYYRDRK